MSSEVAALEADVKEYQEQLDTVVASLQADPDNVELQTLKSELDEAISVTQSAIADLTPASAQHSQKPPPPPPVEEKWSKEKHPAFQPGYKRAGAPATPPPDEAPAVANFKVNDTVLAKWLSGDKAFYPARITSITGSSAAPVYNVTFKSYNNSETLRASDIKPIANDSKKRKADAAPASQQPLPTSAANSNVISAAANIDPDLASQAKKEPSKVSDGPTRPPKVPRKVKATKELEAGKTKWQDFSSKGKFGKAAKKDSMFRTGESITARVGFTGSGTAMRKDPARSRHIYQPVDDDG